MTINLTALMADLINVAGKVFCFILFVSIIASLTGRIFRLVRRKKP